MAYNYLAFLDWFLLSYALMLLLCLSAEDADPPSQQDVPAQIVLL